MLIFFILGARFGPKSIKVVACIIENHKIKNSLLYIILIQHIISEISVFFLSFRLLILFLFLNSSIIPAFQGYIGDILHGRRRESRR